MTTTDAEKIKAVVAELQTDSKKLHDVIHGSNSQDVTVDSGTVKTMAKAIKTIGDTGSTAVTKVTNDGLAAVKKVTDDGAAAVSKVTNDGAAAVKKVQDDGLVEVTKVTSDGAAAVKKVSDDGLVEVNKVTTDGAAAVKKVSDDGAAAIAHLKTLSLYLKTDFTNISVNDALAKLGLGGLNRGSNALDSYTDNTTLSSISKNSIFAYPTTASDSPKASSAGIVQTWIIDANNATQMSITTSVISASETAVQYRVKTAGTYGNWQGLGGTAPSTTRSITSLALIGDSQGSESAAVIDKEGTLLMWGAGSHHQLGLGNDVSDKSSPVTPLFPPGTAAIRKIFKSARCCIVQATDDSIFVWGQNTTGCLGVGHSALVKIPTKLDSSSGVLKGFIIKSVSIWFGNVDNRNRQHTVMLSESGVVAVCGSGHGGRLGLGNTNDQTTFQKLTTSGGIVTQAVAVGGEYGKIFYLSDRLYAGGSNISSAPLGDGTTTQRNTPVAIDQYLDSRGTVHHGRLYDDFNIVYDGTNFTGIVTQSGTSSSASPVYQWGNDDMYLTQTERKRSNLSPEYYGHMKAVSSWTPTFTKGDRIFFYTKGEKLFYKYSNKNISFISKQAPPTDKGDFVEAAYSQSFTGKTILKTIFSNNNQMAILLSDFSIYALGYNDQGNLGLGDNTLLGAYVAGTTGLTKPDEQIVDLAFVGFGKETSLCFINRGGEYFQSGPVGAHNILLNDKATVSPIKIAFD